MKSLRPLLVEAFTPSSAIHATIPLIPSRLKKSEKNISTIDARHEGTEQTAAGEDEHRDLLICG